MEFITLIQYGTPVILLGLIISNVYLKQAVKNLQEDVRDIKTGITWGDTCEQKHTEVDRRLERLESNVNNR